MLVFLLLVACIGSDPLPGVSSAPSPVQEPVDPLPEPDAPPPPALGAEPYAEVFAEVAEIRWTPYAGILRGPEGTASAHSGSAADQALLLGTRLAEQGKTVRYATGTLDDKHVAALLGGLTPAGFAGVPVEGQEPLDPAAAPELQAIAQDHVWVEVKEIQGWIALDPTIPGLAAGESAIPAEKTYDEPPDDWFHTLKITAKQRVDGRTRTLTSVDGRAAEAATHAMRMVVLAKPAAESEGEAPPPAGLAGGLGGGLGGFGGRPEPEPEAPEAPPEPIGTTVTRTLYVGDKAVASKSHLIRDDEPDTQIEREWLEIQLKGPGYRYNARRITWAPTGPNDRPPAYRSYDLGVFTGPVDRDDVDLEILAPDTWESEVAGWSDPSTASVEAAMARAGSAGSAVGQALTVMLAAEGDAVTAAAGARFGVTPVHHQPRILIASQETDWTGDELQTEFSVDLRIDRVRGVPYRGAPEGAPAAFQRARGIAENAVEGSIVEQVVQRPALTTGALQAAGGEWVVLSKGDPLDGIAGLSDLDEELVQTTLKRGHQVALPTAPVTIDGTPHMGWWDIDPQTGEWIGVMEGGQHQAMAQYSVSLQAVGVNDDMGFLLGLHAGAIGTQVLIARAMLRYNELTDEIKQDIKDFMATLGCAACPGGAELSAGGGVSVGADCYTLWEKGVSVGMKGGVDFCEKYQKGIACATAIMLDGIESQTPDVAGGAGFNLSVPMDCD